MELLLGAKMLWQIVSGDITCPHLATRPIDYMNWKFDDAQAKAWIYVNLEDPQHNHVKGLATSHSMWEAMGKVHGAQGQGRLNFLLRKFINYKAGASETIGEVSSELTRLQSMIRDIKATEAPTDLNLALVLINSVDNEAYTIAKYHLEDMRELSLADTKERLKLVEQKIKDENSQGGETANNASGRGSKRKCYHCDKPGHIKIKCYKWLATDEGKEYAKTHPNDEAKKADLDPSATPQRGRSKKPASKKKRTSNARAAQEDRESDESEDAWMVKEDDQDDQACIARKGQDESLNAWIIDSGASRHMTPNGNIFTSKRSIKAAVTVANGENLHAKGVGNVSFDIEGQNIRMTDVLHVPEVDANLLSISALNRKGLSVLFRKDGVDIRQGDNLVASGIMRGKIYFLRSPQTALLSKDAGVLEDISDFSEIENLGNAETTTPNTIARKDINEIPEGSNEKQIARKLGLYKLWHARMGHVNPKRLGSLSQHVTGIDQIIHPNLESLNCSVCNFTNMTRVVNRDTPRRVDRRLGRVHKDVWGPYREVSIGGHRYFVSLIDDLTRRSWLLCMRSRREIYEKIGEWQTAIGLQTGEKVAIYRCDNAKEYQKFERIIHADGVRMEYTTAYTPEENGVAERFNRTIIQMTRAMLIWSGLPQGFWGEAACTANYLRNLLPAGRDDLSPIELWHGHKPNISHIRTFGCVVHVHIPSENRAKLDRVSFQGIFVGYHSSQQMRIYNPKTKRVQWHTSVKFSRKCAGGEIVAKFGVNTYG